MNFGIKSSFFGNNKLVTTYFNKVDLIFQFLEKNEISKKLISDSPLNKGT